METAIALSPVLPLYRDPDARSERVDELLYGMACDVTDTAPDPSWVRVTTRYGYEGWLAAGSLNRDTTTARSWEVRASSQVVLAFSDVLAQPRDGAPVLLTLPRGAELQPLADTDGRWRKVALADGTEGWTLAASLHSPDGLPQPGSDAWRLRVVRTAMGYLGTQYRWGGKSPLGIDCSGLSSMAYALNGVRIPRDADAQQASLTAVSRQTARAGDLLFSPGHVMVYLGGGAYVHATGREGVVLVNSLNPDDPNYREDIDRHLTGIGTLPA